MGSLLYLPALPDADCSRPMIILAPQATGVYDAGHVIVSPYMPGRLAAQRGKASRLTRAIVRECTYPPLD
jgi:hypothetical protein